LDQYCDAIILLDDGSTDGSYETAMSEKLVIKAKKLPEALFDDLKLRNITLDLAAFINAEWLFFFDADERFHEKYADLYSIANRQDVDSVSFSVIHLWNDESCYKVNLPESANGILPRLRMFRCYGRLQIVANRMLHFPATPFQQKKYKAPVLIKHYGNIDPATRKMKYERYTRQDKEGLTQGYTYDYLIEDHADLKPVASLSVDIFSKR
jgi:glycosyltransferase involved in cell wall biosynthesis